jgi:hypothetical protein
VAQRTKPGSAPSRIERHAAQPAGAPCPEPEGHPVPIEGYVLLKIAQTLVFGLITVVIGGPFARMLANRLSRRDVQPKELQEMGERLTRIEQAVNALSNDVMRLTEVQRITSRLLAGDPPPRSDRSALSVSTRR